MPVIIAHTKQASSLATAATATFLFPMADHVVILASKSCVCSVSICNDISCISVLPAAQFLGFMSDLSLADSSGPFNEKRTKMTVASF